MNQINDTYFPAHFISNYISDPAGLVRFQTYCTFRFLSFADPNGNVLPERLCRELSLEADTLSFSVIETYLARDYYFSPSLRAGSFDHFTSTAQSRSASRTLPRHCLIRCLANSAR